MYITHEGIMNDTGSEHEKQHSESQTITEKRVAFTDIAQGHNEVLIEYEGQVYRLRCTRNGKLILNK